MKKSIIEIYAMAVCFVTLVCAAISLGVGIYDIVEISNPEFTLSGYQYERHQTNEAFFNSDDEKCENLSEEDQTKRRIASFERALKVEKRDAFQSFIRVIIIILIDAIVFFTHWRIARRAREVNVA